jgi:hypothetical protein
MNLRHPSRAQTPPREHAPPLAPENQRVSWALTVQAPGAHWQHRLLGV